MTGETVSRYRVLDKLGQGGMAVVYRGEDTRLGRPVALKFLAAHLVADPAVQKRFQREARAAASLSHPNICTIFDIDEADGKTFLAMELVNGESLEALIARGPVAVSEVVAIARQIAEGLQAAHAAGVVHRDIKPANILVTPERRVKILDFGLALLAEGSRLTRIDSMLGTVSYMSPEQAQGSDVDHRTDLWSLGCVIYELVSGQRPFKGKLDQAVIYELVNEEQQPLTAVRTDIPVALEFLVDKCLAKDASHRYQSATEVIVDLEDLADRLSIARGTTIAQTGAHRKRSWLKRSGATSRGVIALRRYLRLTSALLVATALSLAVLAFVHFRESPVERPVRKWSLTPEALSTGVRSVAISPDGRHIAYVAGPGVERLWVRDVDRMDARELPGTDRARQPFWSPDSRYIGFAAGGELKRVVVQGGTPSVLCAAPGGVFGGTWSPDGDSVVFSTGSPSRIFEVPAQGGEPRLLFEPEGTAKGSRNFNPHFLPAGTTDQSLLLEVGSPTEGDIVLKSVVSGAASVLTEGSSPVYSSTGHVVFERQGGVWALPFSIDTLTPTGEPFPITESGGVHSVASDGTLVSVELRGGTLSQLVWRGRDGKKLGTIGRPQEDIRSPALSPDGSRVAVRSGARGHQDIWIHEVQRDIVRRLSFHPASETRPQWSPSGLEISFQSLRAGTYDVFQRTADGTGDATLLIGSEAIERPYGWSRDGKYLVYVLQAAGRTDVWYLERKSAADDFEAHPFLTTPSSENAPSLSPDGRYLAYCSNLSGKDQVYVRQFPSGGGQWQVSSAGGCQPRWSGEGEELFYVMGDTLYAVALTTGPVFIATATTPLFSDPRLAVGSADQVSYDVSADGRFVLVDAAETAESQPPSIRIVENWNQEFSDQR
jgi:Tol biopolymer transport system component/predicted Ser/Thr protein kinase